MKILLGLFLCLSFVVNSFGSPLLFKLTKTNPTSLKIETGIINTEKVGHIRIVIGKQLIDEGSTTVLINGVEADKNFIIESRTFSDNLYQTVIECPPSQIEISVFGKGDYYILVYGS